MLIKSFHFYHIGTSIKRRIVSVAWCLLNYNLDEKYDIKNYIRTLEGFTIENSHIHKITNEIASTAGVPFNEICEHLSQDILNADYFIAHNAKFDYNILLNELHRSGKQDLVDKLLLMDTKKAILCSGELSKDICKFRFFNKGYKMPKLKELYQFIFGHEPEIQHEAYNDVQTLIEIMINKKI